MNSLIENLLSLAKIEAGHLSLEVNPHSAKSLVDEALELVGPLAAKRSIRLDREVLDGDTLIECDRTKAIRVFSNLLGNAIKFVEDGGQVTVFGKPEGTHYLFAIQDNGPGISEQALPHIFDRFWQERKAGSGAGLGLSIVKGLVEAHHGKVWVKSRLGEGSTFSFTLPLKQRQTNLPPARASEQKIA